MFLSFSRCSGRCISEADRSSLSEPDTTEEEEAEDQLYEVADRGAGKALPQAKVFGLGRAGGIGQVAQDDGRAGEDLVPKQADEMEVSSQ